MSTSSPTPPVSPAPAAPRRRPVRLRVLGAVILAPFLFVAVAACGFLTLERDASLLRREVMRATNTDWDTMMQVSVGRVTLSLARTCLRFVRHDKIEEARLALAAVRSASVGVYRLHDGGADWSRSDLMNRADALMARRGWARMVGVADKGETVMIYVPEEADEPDEICLAVVGRDELVVVSAALKPAALVELVEQASDGKLRKPWRNVRL